jgi:hypothetical protein
LCFAAASTVLLTGYEIGAVTAIKAIQIFGYIVLVKIDCFFKGKIDCLWGRLLHCNIITVFQFMNCFPSRRSLSKFVGNFSVSLLAELPGLFSVQV